MCSPPCLCMSTRPLALTCTHAQSCIHFHILLPLNLLQVCQQASHFCAVIRQTVGIMTLPRDRRTSQRTHSACRISHFTTTAPNIHGLPSLPRNQNKSPSLQLSTLDKVAVIRSYFTNAALSLPLHWWSVYLPTVQTYVGAQFIKEDPICIHTFTLFLCMYFRGTYVQFNVT